jgi:hypothetical protein
MPRGEARDHGPRHQCLRVAGGSNEFHFNGICRILNYGSNIAALQSVTGHISLHDDRIDSLKLIG